MISTLRTFVDGVALKTPGKPATMMDNVMLKERVQALLVQNIPQVLYKLLYRVYDEALIYCIEYIPGSMSMHCIDYMTRHTPSPFTTFYRCAQLPFATFYHLVPYCRLSILPGG